MSSNMKVAWKMFNSPILPYKKKKKKYVDDDDGDNDDDGNIDKGTTGVKGN
jgi:hypothetical protein